MGPQVSRSNVNTAPLAPLQGPTTDFLMSILRGGQGDVLSRIQGLTGLQGLQPSDLQRQTGGMFSRLMGGTTAQEQAFNIALPGIQQQLTGTPGADILGAATPIFQRNLAEAQAFQRQFGGPRFASESGRQARQLSERSLQDFNLFQQQVMESGRARQLQAAGVLGALGGGADTSRLGLTQGAGQFALGEQGLNLQNQAQMQQLLQFFLGQAFGAGGAQSPAVITQSPSAFGQIMGGIGGLGALATGLGGMGWNPFGSGGAG